MMCIFKPFHLEQVSRRHQSWTFLESKLMRTRWVTQCPGPREAWRQDPLEGQKPLLGELTLPEDEGPHVRDLGGPPALPPASLGKLRGKQGGISVPSAGKASSSIRPWEQASREASVTPGHGAWPFTCAHCLCVRTASACASALTWRCMCINDPATAPDRPRGPHALGCCLCRKAFTQRPSWSSTCACTGARGPWSASHPCGRPSVSARTWRGTADHTLGRGGRTLTALLGVKVTVTVRGAATY